ncbi:OmpA/MotB family protein [Marinospirillum insulare]|uniref:Chemotaxis protein MotB n=1 Tax=Marinospirillum insulare TaxID=217169 RepID=A0ABQ5ZW74_9GAMM|nr:OmpA family protein [Marinospirillum insulare]GLR64435.1 chemotaxis protein MotB [Marinospirillum insulare]
MRKYHKAPPVDEENSYWMSFSDVMSALLVIFILAAVALMVQLLETEAELKEKVDKLDQEIQQLKIAEKVRKTILEEAAEELTKLGIQVVVSENDSVLRIPNDLLGFSTAAYEIQPQFHETAYAIGKVLHKVISREDRIDYLDTIFIEGHTDNRSFNGVLGKGNWGLSTFRAITLWQFWTNSLPARLSLQEMLNKDDQRLFSVSGYAETRPVTKQQITLEELSANRRIDIRITIRRPKSQEIERAQLNIIEK